MVLLDFPPFIVSGLAENILPFPHHGPHGIEDYRHPPRGRYGTKTDLEHVSGADYSGATKKTSAEEIALVRKLDYRIMPTLWAMYFLNYVSQPLETCVYSHAD